MSERYHARGGIVRDLRFTILVAVSWAFCLLSEHAQAADYQLTASGQVSFELLNRPLDASVLLAVKSVRNAKGNPLPLPQLVGHIGKRKARARTNGRGVCGETYSDLSLGTTVIVSESARRGCRVYLDADATTSAIEPFDTGTVFSFALVQSNRKHGVGANADDTVATAQRLRITQLYSDVPDYMGRVMLLQQEEPMPPGGKLGLPSRDWAVLLRVDMDDDGDGLWNDWETHGIDANADGVIDLRLPNANRYRKDIYVEIDAMKCPPALESKTTHCHRPNSLALVKTVAAFAAAPVANPLDPSTGLNANGVTLHLEVDEDVVHRDVTIWNEAEAIDPQSVDCSAVANQANFACEKRLWFGSAQQRSSVATLTAKSFAYHYSFWAHAYRNSGGSSGVSETPGNDMLVTLGASKYAVLEDTNHHVGSVWEQAGTFMHELGHNFGLRHGGSDDINYKPNYLSIMNYRWQYTGIPNSEIGPRLDYSRQELITLDERALVEADGVLGTGPHALTPAVKGDLTGWCPLPNRRRIPFGKQEAPLTGRPISCHAEEPTAPTSSSSNTHWLNWNFSHRSSGDAITETADLKPVSVNLNGGNDPYSWGLCNGNSSGGTEILKGWNDWSSLIYEFQNTPEYGY